MILIRSYHSILCVLGLTLPGFQAVQVRQAFFARVDNIGEIQNVFDVPMTVDFHKCCKDQSCRRVIREKESGFEEWERVTGLF